MALFEAPLASASLMLILLLSSSKGAVSLVRFTITNNCSYTVWPGILSNASTPELGTTGFVLQQGESNSLDAPGNWSGRFWGRTLCTNDSNGNFTCFTGDCGSGKVECSGGGAAPPATLAEFTLDGSGGNDLYYVSLADGFNLPMLVVPQGRGGSNCSATGCPVDLNAACPSDLKVVMSTGGAVACRSAFEAFGSPQYACSGPYGNPDTCKPSSYSQFFKNACPRAYSYAYDDANSTFTCTAVTGYTITFCPSSSTGTGSSKKHSENPKGTAGLPPISITMMFQSGHNNNQTSPATHSKLRTLVIAITSIIVSLLAGAGVCKCVCHCYCDKMRRS